MTILLGLCFITLIMLVKGMGIPAALGLWLMAALNLFINTTPDTTFTAWLFLVGLAALIVQLVLNLGPEKKKDKK